MLFLSSSTDYRHSRKGKKYLTPLYEIKNRPRTFFQIIKSNNCNFYKFKKNSTNARRSILETLNINADSAIYTLSIQMHNI